MLVGAIPPPGLPGTCPGWPNKFFYIKENSKKKKKEGHRHTVNSLFRSLSCYLI
jgi:hypothetical protein